MSLKKQLHSNFHNEEILRDLLLTSVYIHSIQVSLTDLIPRISQQSVIRMSNQLSDKEKYAEYTSIFLSESSDGKA